MSDDYGAVHQDEDFRTNVQRGTRTVTEDWMLRAKKVEARVAELEAALREVAAYLRNSANGRDAEMGRTIIAALGSGEPKP